MSCRRCAAEPAEPAPVHLSGETAVESRRASGMRLVAPFGFYGWGNIGDEATLQGFARLLARYDPRASAWVASRDPEHTARAEPAFHYFKATDPSLRRWWANRRAQGAVIV